MLKANRLRQKLQQGLPVSGSCLYSWSPNAMEMAGFCGLDFMRIDNEHAWRQDDMAEQLIRAADVAGIVPILRVDRDNPYLVRKALEIGAGGIIVPDVYCPEDAEKVVAAAKFPPAGARGYSGNCRAARWGLSAGKTWVEWSDTEPLIGIMIENVKAMEQLDEIVAVDGIDFFLFGPADYSMSLGLGAPQASHPDVVAALVQTIDAAKKKGKYVMRSVATNEEDIQKYLTMGLAMFEFTNDLGILGKVWGESHHTLSQIHQSFSASPVSAN